MSRNLKQDAIREVKVLTEKLEKQPCLEYTIKLITDMNGEIDDLEYRLSCALAERASYRALVYRKWEKLPWWKRVLTMGQL